MSGHEGPRVGAIPLGLLGAVALCVAVEAGIARRTLDFITPLGFQYRATADAVREVPDAEIACFGDSLIKVGVLPRVLIRATGRPAYNFAVLGGQPTTGYFLLRRMLDRGSPKAILVGYTASMLQINPRDAVRGLNEIVRPDEALGLAWTARDASLLAEMLLARAVPSYRCRMEIRANLAHALRGEVPSERWGNLIHLRNWRVNRGSQVSPPAAASGRAVPECGPADLAENWSPHPLNAVYLKRFLAMADARGIPVYWLLPPIRPDVQKRLERVGVDARYVRFVRKLQARFPRMTVVDGRHSGYESTLFSDPIHIHRQGAPAFSEGIAEVLTRHRDRTAGPRWVALPHYRKPGESQDAAVEDMAQTLAALRARPTRRR